MNMVPGLDAARSALATHTTRFAEAAAKTERAARPATDRVSMTDRVSLSGQSPDLASATIDRISSAHAFRATLEVVRVAEDIARELTTDDDAP